MTPELITEVVGSLPNWWQQVVISLLSGVVGAAIAIGGNALLGNCQAKRERRNIAMLEALNICFKYFDRIEVLRSLIADNSMKKCNYSDVLIEFSTVSSIVRKINFICPAFIFEHAHAVNSYIMLTYRNDKELQCTAMTIALQIINQTSSSATLFEYALSCLKEKDIPEIWYNILKENMEIWFDLGKEPNNLDLIEEQICSNLSTVQLMSMNVKIESGLSTLQKDIENYFGDYLAKKIC